MLFYAIVDFSLSVMGLLMRKMSPSDKKSV